MALVYEKMYQAYSNLMDQADPRMNVFLMKSPVPVHLILVGYLFVVFKLGPFLMKNRKPFVLKEVIMAYNIIQIILNLYVFIVALSIWPKMNIFCSPVDKSDSPEAATLVHLNHIYALLKFLDFFDTIFFVLRKKSNQISFLHVYHHTIMGFSCWWVCKFFPGGQTYFLGLPNSFVHVVMYFYYFLTSWSPSYKQSVWWKRHITELQLVQHCFIFVSFTLPLLNSSCSYPKILLALYIPQTIMMIYLFSEFYIKAYLKKPQDKVK